MQNWQSSGDADIRGHTETQDEIHGKIQGITAIYGVQTRLATATATYEPNQAHQSRPDQARPKRMANRNPQLSMG